LILSETIPVSENKCQNAISIGQPCAVSKNGNEWDLNRHSLELNLVLGLGTHLFVKVLRPGVSEVIFAFFKLSCHL